MGGKQTLGIAKLGVRLWLSGGGPLRGYKSQEADAASKGVERHAETGDVLMNMFRKSPTALAQPTWSVAKMS